MCSCSFIIPYPYFDVNEIQHAFLAVFVVFIGCTLLILFVFCIFMFFSIDFVFLLCHTWIYIEIPLFFLNLCKADVRIPFCYMLMTAIALHLRYIVCFRQVLNPKEKVDPGIIMHNIK